MRDKISRDSEKKSHVFIEVIKQKLCYTAESV